MAHFFKKSHFAQFLFEVNYFLNKETLRYMTFYIWKLFKIYLCSMQLKHSTESHRSRSLTLGVNYFVSLNPAKATA